MDRFIFQLCITVSLLGAVCRCWEATVPLTVTGIKRSCVLVPCSTVPYSKVSWYKYRSRGYPVVYSNDQSEILDELKGRTSVPGSAEQGNCSLKIDNLQDGDSTDNVYVWVWLHGGDNRGFYKQTTTKINLLEPQNPTISVQNRQVEGMVFSAKCTFRTSCPTTPARLSWIGLGNRSNVVNHTQRRDTLWDTEATATFVVTRRDQGTRLSCETTLGGRSFQSDSIKLDVVYAPTDVRVNYKENSTVVEGKELSLKCTSDGNPAATHYEWVVNRNKATSRYEGNAVVLQNITRDTSIFCIVSNSVGHGESKRLSLSVHYPPSIINGTFCTTENGTLKCVCKAEANPNAVISWSIDGHNALFPPFNTTTRHNGRITVSELTGAWGGEGNVKCTSTNLAGTRMNEMPIHSKRIGLPMLVSGAGAAVVCVIIGLVAAIVICKKRRRAEQPVELAIDKTMRSKQKINHYHSDEDLYVNTQHVEQACKNQDSKESCIYENYDKKV